LSVQIISALITLGGLGLLFGAVLAYASKIFHVEKDPRIEQVNEILPQANCGGCGYPGCLNYAEAVVVDEADITLCAPGGDETISKIAQIIGVEAETKNPMVAVVQCQGAHDIAKDKFLYEGIADCNAEDLILRGHKVCEYGCLGHGSCVKACPFDAMAMLDNGLPTVFEDKCTACGICVETCPKGIMQLIPRSQKVFLGCVNQNAGKSVRQACSVGCIGCGLCAKPNVTPSGKIEMEDNLPIVPADWEDYETAVNKCPTKSFVVRIEEEAPAALSQEEETVPAE
jgi:Na+-translocating ferredoxin:NAD+ oxidoreductase RNF subunit RnfB